MPDTSLHDKESGDDGDGDGVVCRATCWPRPRARYTPDVRALSALPCLLTLLCPLALADPPDPCRRFATYDVKRCIRARTTKLPNQLMVRGSLGLGSGWDSNAPRQDNSHETPHAAVMRFTPRFTLNLPHQRLFGVALEVKAMIPFYLPNPAAVLSEGGGTDVSTELAVTVGARKVFAGIVYHSLRRSLEPDDATVVWPSPHVENIAGLLFRGYFKAGLRLEGRYELMLNDFDEASFERSAHLGLLQLAWGFSARAETWLRISSGISSFDNPTPGQDAEALPTRAVVGIAGYMNRTLLGILEAGYGDSLSDRGPRYQSGIGRAALIWRFTPTDYFGFGYVRDFRPSSWAGQYGEDRVYLRFGFRPIDRVAIEVDGSYTLMSFGPREPQSASEFISHRRREGEGVKTHIEISVDLTSWLRLHARYDLELLESEFRVQRIDRVAQGFESQLMLWQLFRQRAGVDLEFFISSP